MECGRLIGGIRKLRMRISGTDGWQADSVDIMSSFEHVSFDTRSRYVDEYGTEDYVYTSITSL